MAQQAQPMNSAQSAIDTFFQEYENRFNLVLQNEEVQPEDTASAFAEYFVEAGPQGVMGGKNDETFLAAIPKGNAFYKSIGTKSMRVRNKTIIPIDPLHVMVKVHWSSEYERKDKKQVTIDFDVTYLLQLREKGPKIFAYITGDEQKVLKEQGLI